MEKIPLKTTSDCDTFSYRLVDGETLVPGLWDRIARVDLVNGQACVIVQHGTEPVVRGVWARITSIFRK